MLTPTAVLAELAKIKPFYGKQAPDLDAQLGAIYADVLNQAGVTTQTALNTAMRQHLANPDEGKYWPKPANLIGGSRAEKVSSIEVAVGTALTRLDGMEFWVYNPAAGGYYDTRAIREKLGVEVLECFIEAGGSSAFGGDGEARKWAAQRFTEAYRRRLLAAEKAGQLDVGSLPQALPPAPEQKRLAASPEMEPISRERAVAIVRSIEAARERVMARAKENS